MTITYPRDPLKFRVRVALNADLTAKPNTWTWTEITEDVSFSRSRIFQIAVGSQDEQQESDSSLGLVLRNHESAYVANLAGRYTSDNANSDLWPYFDVGLPIEFAVDPGDGVWHVLAIEYLGEAVNSWPGGSKHVALTSTTWSGLMRRLQRYKTAVSPLYRTLATANATWKQLHYWPIEQATAATVRSTTWPAAGPNASTTPPLTSSPTFAGTEQPPTSSLALPLWGANDRLRVSLTNDGNFGKNNGTYAAWTLGFIFRATLSVTSGTVTPTFWITADTQAGSYKSGQDANLQPVPAFALSIGGQYKDGVYVPGSGVIKVTLSNAGAAVVTGSTTDVDLFDGEWVYVQLRGVAQDSPSSPGTPFATMYTNITKPTRGNVIQQGVTDVPGSLIGKPTSAAIGGAFPNLATTINGATPDNNAAGLRFSAGHVSYTDETAGFPTFVLYSFGSTPENALVRAARVSAEESVPHSPYIIQAPAAMMGPPTVNDLVGILRECEAADHGVLVDRLGVTTLVGSSYMTNRASSLTIDGASTHGPLSNRSQLPASISSTTDDLHLINAVTVTRPNGGSSAATAPYSIARKGRYDSQPSLNAADDRALRGQAGWTLRVGQATGVRYAQLTADLHEHPELIPTVLAMIEAQPRTGYASSDLDPISGIGHRVTISTLPTASAPGSVDVQIRGWAMTIVGRQGGWLVTFNLVPYWPWEVFVIQTGGGNRSRLASGRDGVTGASNSTLATAATANATTMDILNTAGSFTWDGADVPFDLKVDGEPVTATAVTSYLTDTFARTVAAGSWGSPTVGAAYSLVGTAADFSVGSGHGIIAPSASGSDRFAVISGPASPGVMYGEFRATALPANTTGYSMGFVMRRQVVGSAGNHDNFVCQLLVSGSTTVPTVSVRINSRVAGVNATLITAATGWTYVANTWYSVLAYIVGNVAYVRVWPTFDAGAVRQNRIGVWHASYTGVQARVPDSADAVQFGAYARTDDGTTTKVFQVANLQLLTPQKFTVTRSITGVSRAHAVGADVDLWHPAARSLGGMLPNG